MSGMEPMLIGAALGGGISAARGGNPITGALLGGLTGGAGGALWGAAGSAASNAAATGLSTAGGTLAPSLGAGLGAGGSALGSTVGLTAPGAFTGLGLTPAATGLAAGEAALTAPAAFSGVGLTSAAAPTFMQTMSQVPSAALGLVTQNPNLAFQGASAANDMMSQQQPLQMPGASPIMRGQAPQSVESLLALLPQQQRQPISLI